MAVAAELLTVDRASLAVRRMGIAAWPAYDGREPFAEAFLAASNLSAPLRCAHAFAASWRESPTPIGATELFVGVPQPWRAIWLDRAAGIVVKQDMIRRLGTANLAALAAAMTEFETGRIIREEKSAAGVQLDGSLGWGPGYQGHMLPDYATVLAHGIDGFASRLAATPDGQFKACLSLMIGTWRDLLRTYAEAAQTQASVGPPDRAEELRRIADDCRAVIGPPPRTLTQAIQLYWITFLLDGADNAGRLDQLFWPFLREDLAGNRLDGDRAANLLTDLFFKLESAGAWGLVLGGVDAHGTDASNPLTTFFLELAAAFPQTHPAISLRVSRQTPGDLWSQAMRTWLAGAGMPALLNDDAVVPALTRLGVTEADARDYGVGGCIEFQLAGKGSLGGEDGQINLAKCLELALNDGVCAQTGRRLGLATGDPLTFTSFDEVWGAYRRQVEWTADRVIAGCGIGQAVKSRQGTKPMRSLLVADCIERGRDCEDGGARYGHGQILTMGTVVVADSLAVLQHLVFGDGSVALPELIAALRCDWKGHEVLRQRIAATAPRCGNDDARADDLAAKVAGHLWSYIGRFKTRRGGPYTGLLVYYTRALDWGRCTGATPDGRRSGDLLEDSAGPWPGRDRKGPTAMLRSAAAIPQHLAGGGAILNLKLEPKALTTPNGCAAAIALVQGYFSMGGQQVQATVVSAEDLIAATRDPERWGNLIVRVGGFSARFTALEQAMQQAIIARTSLSGQ